jgi:hypothetical protein
LFRHFFVVILGWGGYAKLDEFGMISHEEKSWITAQANWIVGETKTYTSVPLTVPEDGKTIGFAMSKLTCDDGKRLVNHPCFCVRAGLILAA